MKIFFLLAALIVSLSSCKHDVQNNNDPNLSPLDKLKAGNERFVKGFPVHPNEMQQRMRELKDGQHPFAVIMSCSDSRVSPEY